MQVAVSSMNLTSLTTFPIIQEKKDKVDASTQTSPAPVIPTAITIENPPSLTRDWILNEFNKKPAEQDDNLVHLRKFMNHAKLKGGFIESDGSSVNLPLARTEFALLALTANEEIKVEALDHLVVMLKNNPIDARAFHNLMVLERNCREYMRPEVIQEENQYVQIKMVRAYALILEAMVNHVYKGNAGAITARRKEDIWTTTEGIKALNRKGNTILEMLVRRSIEAAKRLKSDESTLWQIIKRSKNFLSALLLIKSEDYMGSLDQLHAAFHHIAIKSGWYDGMLEMKNLREQAKEDPIVLSILQELIQRTCLDENNNWELIASAIDVLTEIAIFGKTDKIRLSALIGDHSIPKHPRPGIIAFTDFNNFFYNNWRVRYNALDALIRVRESDDPVLKRIADEEISKRIALEPKQFNANNVQMLLNRANTDKVMVWYRTSDQHILQYHLSA